jgi:shikimate kinase
MNISNNKKIFLIGMMGSGKSSVGLKLSRLISISFYDIDNIIGVPKSFNNNTLKDFRNKEFNKISMITNLNKKCLIASGGGSILNQQTRDIMESCYCIYLKTSINILMERIINHNIRRPIINYNTNGEINKTHFSNLYKTRISHYKKLSNLTIVTDNVSVAEVVNQIKDTILKDEVKN